MRNGPDPERNADWQEKAGSRSAAPLIADDDPPLPRSRNVLSPAEIEALLRPVQQKGALEPAPSAPQNIALKPTEVFDVPPAPKVTPVPPEFDHHAQRLGAQIALALATGAGVKSALSVAAQALLARADLPGLMQGKSSAIACIGPTETDIRALICIPPLLADAIIAKACGARGSTGRIGDGWSLSAIDCALLEQLLVGFGPAIGKGFRLQAIETDVAYVSSLLPVSEVAVSEFSIEAPGLRSELAVIEGQFLDQDIQPTATEPTVSEARSEPQDMTAILTARLASLTVPLSRLTELKAGSTLLLGLPADQPVELLSGGRDGKPVFEGAMGRKSNQMAVKLTKRLRRL
ncbi:MAG: FliM/FliN family flagellar motor switch protein [Pseudomonadota bacterium]